MSESDMPGYDPTRDDPDLTVDGEDTEELAETDFSPPDFEPKSLHEETTEEEVREGESLDQRLSEETPDVDADFDPQEPEPRAGRLVEAEDPVDSAQNFDLAADDAGFAGYAASAEEAAVHLEEDEG